ncbi:hypothetical protein Achl_0389 [Pseudarthrobacter chlorophenolicus A6]|uniref:JmjC domain-containing protein n=1 Tax=Pseudarthrobacter chlorophenolicus (strain ATCC 700700 / DSM 12829 / CIP 107037 / JCM 12360 / KCTC 9906 / NCIMB 13794 / A6) TaxID=452863 RepID=B8HA04_PSECP|nr:hypothetical protein [Pseudarthrobacter chlorophenolicus]ACL38388.1 hypothetical protein Achl_0389 [Pseudarthrobacter chlorophenolicus A6]
MDLSHELGVAIDRALTSQTSEPRYRVFKDGTLDYRACNQVARRWKAGAGKPQDQLREIAGNGAVLALNDVAAWNDNIRRCLTEDSRPLPATVSGDDVVTTDVYAFVSTAAGWTAFGAHVDFEHSIILDLDGAGRDVVTWPEGARYGQRMNDAKAFFGISMDWKEWLADSTRYRLAPGDIAVIRARQPHIFHANGPGMFLGISTVGHNTSSLGSSVSELAAGAALVPKHDSDLVSRITNAAVPPPVRLVDSVDLEVTPDGLRSHGKYVALSSTERNLFTANTAANIVAAFGAASPPAIRTVIAKLVMIGAAIVHPNT